MPFSGGGRQEEPHPLGKSSSTLTGTALILFLSLATRTTSAAGTCHSEEEQPAIRATTRPGFQTAESPRQL